MGARWRMLTGDVRAVLPTLPAKRYHCVATSPPYWQHRDYGTHDQLGSEDTPQEYVDNLVAIFREVKRVLRDDGVVWLNLGDAYANSGGKGGRKDVHPAIVSRRRQQTNLQPRAAKSMEKQLLGLPWRVAFALQDDGWLLRPDVIWFKTNPMPTTAKDRPCSSHEHVFLLAKSPRYFYDRYATMEDVSGTARPRGSGVNPKAAIFDNSVRPRPKQNASMSAALAGIVEKRFKRDVWSISTQPFKGAHFATFPELLVEPCILAATSAHGCCNVCGTPWHRSVERTRTPTRPARESKLFDAGIVPTDAAGRKRAGNRDPERHVSSYATTGWQPGCDCPTSQVARPPVAPCRVLDIFGGSGTTAVVAVDLGRDCDVIESNREYAAMACRRVAKGRTSKPRKKKAV